VRVQLCGTRHLARLRRPCDPRNWKERIM